MDDRFKITYEDFDDFVKNEHLSWPQTVKDVVQHIGDMLLKKHEQYDSSVFRPICILSSANTADQLRIRIDDRLHKLMCLKPHEMEGSRERRIIYDLTGFLINYCAYQSVHNPEIWGLDNDA